MCLGFLRPGNEKTGRREGGRMVIVDCRLGEVEIGSYYHCDYSREPYISKNHCPITPRFKCNATAVPKVS